MATLGKTMTPFSSKDLLVKVLASAFLNPGDRNQKGKKLFIQDFLKCGCPDAVVEQANIHFFVNPLGALLNRQITTMETTSTTTPLEKEVNALLKLPKNLRWPRRHSGQLLAPATWRRSAIREVTNKAGQEEKLVLLRKMAKAVIDAVIEVPGRAFFYLVVQERNRLQKEQLLIQYESGQMLYKLMGYNRCRLFTITEKNESKIIPEIDTALSWQDLHDAFSLARRGYPFANQVMQFFKPVE